MKAMREPGEDDPDDGVIPYDPEWWRQWRERCNALTPEEIESMCPEIVDTGDLNKEANARPLGNIMEELRRKHLEKP